MQAELPLSRTVLALLRTIADRDTGSGVLFVSAPCGRWRLDGTRRVFANRTFFPLDSHGLVDIGNGHTDPVRITDAGRSHLAGGSK
ncbi:hypothetical protein [Streptomyces niveus]|uniref:hypothetical protein n=1 Tax=Streptomyces niveus TaxID=193462 RepID=UPI0036D3CBC9